MWPQARNRLRKPSFAYLLASRHFIYSVFTSSTNNGHDIYRLSKALGHANIGVTETYLKTPNVA
jgi:site-specific recombinase XerD